MLIITFVNKKVVKIRPPYQMNTDYNNTRVEVVYGHVKAYFPWKNIVSLEETYDDVEISRKIHVS